MNVVTVNAIKINKFQALIDDILPEYQRVEPRCLPEPYHHLLVHEGDMTGRLERFHGEPIHLQILKVLREPDSLYRQVLLKTESDKIVEFGVIRIHLDVFEGEARQRVLDCYQPLGGILNQFHLGYQSRLGGFLQLDADEIIRGILKLDLAHRLYGRQNRLLTTDGRTIADVVEILPPMIQ